MEEEREVTPTWLDVFRQDAYVLVSVWAAVFVPSPQGVEYLVQYNPLGLALVSNGDSLLATNTTNAGQTAAKSKTHVVHPIKHRTSHFGTQVLVSLLLY